MSADITKGKWRGFKQARLDRRLWKIKMESVGSTGCDKCMKWRQKRKWSRDFQVKKKKWACFQTRLAMSSVPFVHFFSMNLWDSYCMLSPMSLTHLGGIRDDIHSGLPRRAVVIKKTVRVFSLQLLYCITDKETHYINRNVRWRSSCVDWLERAVSWVW